MPSLVAAYMLIAAVILMAVAALFFAAGLTAGEDQPGFLTFAAISAVFLVPSMGLALAALAVWSARRRSRS